MHGQMPLKNGKEACLPLLPKPGQSSPHPGLRLQGATKHLTGMVRHSWNTSAPKGDYAWADVIEEC